jgi:hypothetical protein
MKKLACSVLLLLASLPAAAQVTIQNPKKLKLPEARVGVIYDVVRELVFQEVKPAGGKPVNMKLTLSLAVRPEFGYLTNEEKQSAEVFMTEWDEPRFAYVVMALAMQQALPASRRSELLKEALRRVDLLAPVDVTQLKKQKIPARILSTPVLAPDPLLLRCSTEDVPQPSECRRTLLPMPFNAASHKRNQP